MARPALLNLPVELLVHIMRFVEPEDLLAIRASCKLFRELCKGNPVVYEYNLRGLLDNPPTAFKPKTWNWERKLKDLIALRDIYGEGTRIESCSWRMPAVKPNDKEQQLLATAKTVDLIYHASSNSDSSANLSFLQKAFDPTSRYGMRNIERYLGSSTLFCRSMLPTASGFLTPAVMYSEDERQASAKLHCYYGVPVTLSPKLYRRPYHYALSVVYDMRNYTDLSLWGPFKPDGEATVDWEKVEAIMIILGHNLKCFDDQTGRRLKPLWTTPWAGSQPDSFRSVCLVDTKSPTPPVNESDPYNITGSWMRIVTFLDYHELFYYNFEDEPEDVLPADVPRPPLHATEAIRLIIMELEVVKIIPSTDPKQPLPKVQFKGISRSLHSPHDPNANSNIRGTVQMTKEGEVRWTTISVYNGEERWKSEGIQIGGIRSARGVLGHWFDRDMDNQQGPAGPTAFWKVSNEVDQAENMDHWIDLSTPSDTDDENAETADEDADGTYFATFTTLGE
ncbi:F-box [Glarea lozoyensis ATCC 20868]|uniref:F-box n=1 Tax=Glarea lozoyensis (strain ATCC 20868 / MF5171) TaxID=1116229 RepID=S3CJ99_GLAL2|nr:F-box [Glarea lozoyensis ATCC 20868]EPE26597.1 F-box [Glarea lozoyensis ATCC 20868]